MLTNIYECFVESTLAIALLVCFISSSPCELAIYYHCPLTEKETKAQRRLLICPRSQLVCGCTDVQTLVMGSLTPGLSWHSGTNSGCMDRERRRQSWEQRWGHPRKNRSFGLRPSEESGQHRLLVGVELLIPYSSLWKMTRNTEDWAKSKYRKSLCQPTSEMVQFGIER